MRYVRWGEQNSNVYIIGESDGGYWCVCCSAPEHRFKTLEGMIRHLDWHRQKGDVVPDFVEERLREDAQ